MKFSFLLIEFSIFFVIFASTKLSCTNAMKSPLPDGGHHASHLNEACNLNVSGENVEEEKVQVEKDGRKPRVNEAEESLMEENSGFTDIMRKCIFERRKRIIQDFGEGSAILSNCFKTSVVINLLKYLLAFPNKSIKLCNGLFEFVKISNWVSCGNNKNGSKEKSEDEDGAGRSGEGLSQRYLSDSDWEFLSEVIIKRLVDKKNEDLNEHSTDLIKDENKVKELITCFTSENSVKLGENRIEGEIFDSKLLYMLNALSNQYLLKINFNSAIQMEIKKKLNGDIALKMITEEFSGNSSEKNDAVENSENLYEQEGRGNNNNEPTISGRLKSSEANDGRKGGKQKSKKKGKRKNMSYKKLIIPFAIQVAIVPFFLKNLMLLATKALLAGKAALVLIAFNILRNAKIKNEGHDIRVQHYGYSGGEEYGAWINGRKFNRI